MHLSLLSSFYYYYCRTYNYIQAQGKMVESLTMNNHYDKKPENKYNGFAYITV